MVAGWFRLYLALLSATATTVKGCGRIVGPVTTQNPDVPTTPLTTAPETTTQETTTLDPQQPLANPLVTVSTNLLFSPEQLDAASPERVSLNAVLQQEVGTQAVIAGIEGQFAGSRIDDAFEIGATSTGRKKRAPALLGLRVEICGNATIGQWLQLLGRVRFVTEASAAVSEPSTEKKCDAAADIIRETLPANNTVPLPPLNDSLPLLTNVSAQVITTIPFDDLFTEPQSDERLALDLVVQARMAAAAARVGINNVGPGQGGRPREETEYIGSIIVGVFRGGPLTRANGDTQTALDCLIFGTASEAHWLLMLNSMDSVVGAAVEGGPS